MRAAPTPASLGCALGPCKPEFDLHTNGHRSKIEPSVIFSILVGFFYLPSNGGKWIGCIRKQDGNEKGRIGGSSFFNYTKENEMEKYENRTENGFGKGVSAGQVFLIIRNGFGKGVSAGQVFLIIRKKMRWKNMKTERKMELSIFTGFYFQLELSYF